jgi:hypothetical protein
MAVSRRIVVAGAGVALMSSFAFAQTRSALPGGGSVIAPSPYSRKPGYPTYASQAPNVLIGYRNWRSTLSGHPECDGMLAVGGSGGLQNLHAFIMACRPALSISWSDADRIPGQAWDGREKRYQMESSDGPNGPETIQRLAVHRVGFFGVYDEPAHMYAVQHALGVFVGVWLYDKHGGVASARKISHRIAASFEA